MKKPAKLVWIVLVLSLAGIIGSWIYVPSVKVATYRALFAVGLPSVRLWVLEQLPVLGLEAYPVIKMAFDEDPPYPDPSLVVSDDGVHREPIIDDGEDSEPYFFNPVREEYGLLARDLGLIVPGLPPRDGPIFIPEGAKGYLYRLMTPEEWQAKREKQRQTGR